MLFMRNILMLLILLGGLVALQFFLSSARSRWPGLVLPVLSILFSLLAVAGMTFYSAWTGLLRALIVLMVFNIPTLVFFAIYRWGRERADKGREVDRMNIQDLEE